MQHTADHAQQGSWRSGEREEWTLRALEEVDLPGLGADELLVVPSYEDRSVKSLERILARWRGSRAHVVVFPNYLRPRRSLFPDEDDETCEAYRANLEAMRGLLADASVAADEINGELSAASCALGGISLPPGSLVDISCFPRNHLFELLRQSWVHRCHLVYSRVGSYEDEERKFAVGVDRIICVDGYEGKIRSRPTILCMSLGFEGNRAMAIFRKYDPYRTLALVGRSADARLATIARNNNAQLLANTTVREFEADCLDPSAFAEDVQRGFEAFLAAESKQCEDFDLVASILGPKPQAIGLHYLCAAGYPIHVVYAIPTKRRICSQGIGKTHVFQSLGPK